MNGFGCTQRCFMNIPVGRLRGIATEINSFYQESIRGSEYTPHIMHTSNIIQHHHNGNFLGLFELIY